jgi:hypothetical protein
MAAIDEYAKAGFGMAQARALADLETASWPNAAAAARNIAALVRVGFSVLEAQAIQAEREGNPGAGPLAAAGLWAGTEVPAIIANV